MNVLSKKEHDETINGKTKDNLPKGCTISYKKSGEDK